MVQKRTQTQTDPRMLNHADFRWFVLHFPEAALKDAKLARTSFVAVALALSMYGDYATGTRVNPSKKLLHNQTGAHNDTITKVIEVLMQSGAIEVTGTHQGDNGGKPSEVFRFRRSHAVEKVLAKRDAKDWRKASNTTGEPGNTTGEPGNTTGEPGNTTGEDNRNSMNPSNHSVADAPSPPPLVAQPSARSEADSLDEMYDEILAEVGSETPILVDEPSAPASVDEEVNLDELLAGIEESEGKPDEAMARFYQLSGLGEDRA